jgi:hypothetical protein
MKFQNVIKNNKFLRNFLAFLGQKSIKKISKEHISTKPDKGYRLVYELSYLVEKKISTFYLVRVPTFGQKWTKIFLKQISEK